jgi:hypothetical protein
MRIILAILALVALIGCSKSEPKADWDPSMKDSTVSDTGTIVIIDSAVSK